MPDVSTRDIATRDVATRDVATRDINASGVTTDFVFTMATTAPAETVTIPCQNVGTFNAEIDWGDGATSTITAYNDADLSHEYASAGDHEIRISGAFPNIYFNNAGDRLKVKSVSNLGVVGWESLQRAFYGCSNMASLTVGNTDTSSVTNMESMLRATSVINVDLSSFDTSSVIDMQHMFNSCSSLITVDLSSFNTAIVGSLFRMFYACSSLTSLDLSSFDTSAVTNMGYTFWSCTSLSDIIGVEDFDISALDDTSDLINFAAGVTLPTSRYDALLVNWAAQTVLSGLGPNFGSSKYTSGGAAEAARTSLINDDGWTITDGGAA